MEPAKTICPFSSTYARSDTSSAKCIFCSDNRIATPSAFSATIIRAICSTITGATRALYERGQAPAPGSEEERELVIVCRAYLATTGTATDTVIVPTATSRGGGTDA